MSQPIYQILLDFESLRKANAKAIHEFVQRDNVRSQPQLVKEVVAIDMEYQFRDGCPVSIEFYVQHFPEMANDLPDLYTEIRKDFQQSFCLVSSNGGPLPCRFDHFQVNSELGRGGMGVVYDAVDLRTQEQVALKILFFDRECIEKEATILQNLDHPNICKVTGYGCVSGLPYMTLELVRGANLKKVIKHAGRLAHQQAILIAIKIADAIAHAHNAGIVHFDLKPSNVLISKEGDVTVTDFGIACNLHQTNLTTSLDSALCGSPKYMAPEFFKSEFGQPGEQSDIYSLGVMLYEMLSGSVPFTGEVSVIAERICFHPPSRLSDFPELNISSELEKVCWDALSKSTENRYSSMSQFLYELKRYYDSHFDDVD